MSDAVANFLRVIFPQLSPREREATEEAILAIADGSLENYSSLAMRNRNRLLTKIERMHATLPKTRDALDAIAFELAQIQGKLQTSLVVPTDQEDNLPTSSSNDPVMQRIITHTPALQALAERHIRDVPEPAEAEAAMVMIKEIFPLLLSIPFPSEPMQVIDYAWGFLASICVSVARLLPTFSHDTDLLREVLLVASTYPFPRPNNVFDVQFAMSPSRNWPSARRDATRGLVLLTSG
jgi:hypothetical protein